MIERCEEAQFTARMRPSQLWVALALFLALGLLGSQLVLLSHGRDDDQTLAITAALHEIQRSQRELQQKLENLTGERNPGAPHAEL